MKFKIIFFFLHYLAHTNKRVHVHSSCTWRTHIYAIYFYKTKCAFGKSCTFQRPYWTFNMQHLYIMLLMYYSRFKLQIVHKQMSDKKKCK